MASTYVHIEIWINFVLWTLHLTALQFSFIIWKKIKTAAIIYRFATKNLSDQNLKLPLTLRSLQQSKSEVNAYFLTWITLKYALNSNSLSTRLYHDPRYKVTRGFFCQKPLGNPLNFENAKPVTAHVQGNVIIV